MTFDEYNTEAAKTAVYPGKQEFMGLCYTALKLNGEAGELAELVGKCLRDEAGIMSAKRRDKVAHELGDVLWYIAAIARELDLNLDYVAHLNLSKLASRKERGKLHGDGDYR